jgi:hypothetical protein
MSDFNIPYSRETARSWTIQPGHESTLPNGLTIANGTATSVELLWWFPGSAEVSAGLAIVPGPGPGRWVIGS